MADSDVLPERVQTEEEINLRASLDKYKIVVERSLSTDHLSPKRASENLLKWHEAYTKLLDIVRDSIKEVPGAQDQAKLQRHWNNEDFELVAWYEVHVDKCAKEEDILNQHDQKAMSLDSSIEQISNSARSSIRKYKAALEDNPTQAQLELITKQCEEIVRIIDVKLYNLYEEKAQFLPSLRGTIMKSYHDMRGSVYEDITDLMLNLADQEPTEHDPDGSLLARTKTALSEAAAVLGAPLGAPRDDQRVVAEDVNAGAGQHVATGQPIVRDNQTPPSTTDQNPTSTAESNPPVTATGQQAVATGQTGTSTTQQPGHESPRMSVGEQLTRHNSRAEGIRASQLPKIDFQQALSQIYPPPIGSSTRNNSRTEQNSSQVSFLHGGPMFAQTSQPYQYDYQPNKIYERRKLPYFDGDVLKFPRWFHQMKYSIAKQFSPDDMILILDEKTPSTINLSNNETLEECWNDLLNRYANPAAVVSKVTKEYLEFKPDSKWDQHITLLKLEAMVATTYKALKCVDRLDQLTHVDRMLSHAMECLPETYRDQVIHKQLENANKATGHQALPWDVFHKFLKEKKLSLEKYGGYDLDAILSEKPKKYCKKCNKKHETPVCNTAEVHTVSNTVPDHVKKMLDKQWSSFGPCPVCKKKGHHFKRRDGKTLASSRLYDCDVWMNKSAQEKINLLAKHNGCTLCTSWKHSKKDCNATIKTCRHKTQNGECGEAHNRAFHGLTHAYLNYISVNACVHVNSGGALVLMPMQEIIIRNYVKTTIFFDSGSNVSLITHHLAWRLGLRGKPSQTWIRLAAEEPKLLETQLYTLTLQTNDGFQKKIIFIGVENITSVPKKINIDKAYELFTFVGIGDIERPRRKIGILMGLDNSEFFPYGASPEDGHRKGGLMVYKTPMGSGWMLAGYHPDIVTEREVVIDANIHHLRAAIGVEHHTEAKTINLIQKHNINIDNLMFDDLGIKMPPLCDKCAGCHNCTNKRSELTREEQEMYTLVKQNMTLDEEKNQITLRYPVNDNYLLLQDNRAQIIKRQESVERRLIKKGDQEKYNDNYRDAINRGVLTRVTDKMIEEYKSIPGNRIHYTGHHAVYKESSKSTPLRVVNDSAVKNNYIGPSINDCMGKGPKALNNLLEILLRWRTYDVALILDLKKAYNSVKTTEFERMIRLQVWRWCDTDAEWETYGYDYMAFGDLIASLGLEVAKEVTCEAAERRKMCAEAILKILKDFYVDDGCTGGTEEQVQKLMGDCIVHDDGRLEYTGTIPQVLLIGGFRPKAMISSSNPHPQSLVHLGPVLGHNWDPSEDTLTFQYSIRAKMSPKAKEVEVTIANCHLFEATKRSCLAVSSQFYDPMGVTSPVTIKFKIKMKDIVALQVEWDQILPKEVSEEWQQMMVTMLKSEPVVIPRRAIGRVHNNQEHCELIGFWDGSLSAYCCAIYIRWLDCPKEMVWSTRLLAAKSRVTSTGTTTPRSELCGLLILVRLLDHIIGKLAYKVKRVTLIGDSECTIASYESKHTILAAFFANRIAEITNTIKEWGELLEKKDDVFQELTINMDEEQVTRVDKLMHIAGPKNIADLGTRGTANMEDIGEDSEWQRGPKFLREARSSWPIARPKSVEIPAEERKSVKFKIVNSVQSSDPRTFNTIFGIMFRVSSWRILRGSVARIMKADRYKDAKKITEDPTVEDFRRADHIIFLMAMSDTRRLELEGKLESISPFWEEGVCYMTGRLGMDGVQRILGAKDKLPVISAKTRLAELIMTASHQEDHRRDPGDCLFRSRRHAWICDGARALAERVVRKCQLCKVKIEVLQKQKMSKLPPQIHEVPCSPFTNVTLDFLGPVEIRSMTNKRAHMKAWPLVFVCMNTSALHTELAPGYSTEDFLLCWDGFTSIRGFPKFIYSDQGSQLVGARKLMNTSRKTEDMNQMNVDFDRVAAKTASNGVEWKMAPPESQWRDGRSEQAVKSLKKTLHHLHDGSILNFKEFEVLLQRAADLINARPLGIRATNGANPSFAPITPNLLLKCSRNPRMNFDTERFQKCVNEKSIVRLKAMDLALENWWYLWFRDVMDSLVPYKRWKKSQRNLEKGDICLLMYDKKVGSPKYRICRVSEIYPDAQGDVRTVRIQMRPRDQREDSLPYLAKDLVSQDVSVQRLVLILPVQDQRVEDDQGRGGGAKLHSVMTHIQQEQDMWTLMPGDSDPSDHSYWLSLV